MSIDEADQATPAAPLLRILGDTGAGVCADGFCEVPQDHQGQQGQQAAPGQAATTGADE